jgi:hypothetical protein
MTYIVTLKCDMSANQKSGKLRKYVYFEKITARGTTAPEQVRVITGVSQSMQSNKCLY